MLKPHSACARGWSGRFLSGLLGVTVLTTAVVFVGLSGDAEAQRRRRKRPAKAPVVKPEPAAETAPASDAATTAAPKAAADSGPAPGGPPSPTLEKAKQLYDVQKDYVKASLELQKVIEGRTGDAPANKEVAAFYLGKALTKLKLYAAALSVFNKIVERGPNHARFPATLQWLAKLARELPDSSGILEAIGKYDRAALESPALAPVRDELLYLLGKYHYTKGTAESLNQATQLLESVRSDSADFARAKILEAVTYARLNKPGKAVDALKQVLRKARSYPDPDKRPKAIVEAEINANLQMGRVFYQIGKYKTAIKYFDKVPLESWMWPASLFEASWAHFQIDNFPKALGNIHSLNAPFFENEFYPESHILKALIYFKNCLYDRSDETIKEFNAIYRPLKSQLQAIIARHPDSKSMFGFVMKVRKGDAGLDRKVARLIKWNLSDKQMNKYLEYIKEIDRELALVQQADPAWRGSSLGARVIEDLTVQRSVASNEAGNLAKRRMQRLVKEITDFIGQAAKIDIETLSAKKGSLEASIRNEQIIPATAGVELAINIDDEHQLWPFKGEYWKDELGYYRFRIRSQCRR